MKRIIDIPDEYYKAITGIPDYQCTADMLIIKYSIPHETVTEFADRCKECGAKYGKLLKQKLKTGHLVRWCEIIEKEYCTIHEPHCKCSECNREYEPYIASSYNYCPNCGCRMVEPQERSKE